MNDASGAAGLRAQGRVGTFIDGKWRIDARLGAGGMATVYAATDASGERVAVKMLHAHLSREPSVRARFLREAYVANTIAHPNVCRVLADGTTDDGCAYLLLELLEGETMEARRLACRGGAMPLDEVLDVADAALDALAAAHDKGIIHRDLKPENIFLTAQGTVKVLDFGLAHMKGGEATQTGVTIGTPEFMPPEQALGRRDTVDARSDVWGLGAAMFTSLAGVYVHHASNVRELLLATATRRPRSLREVAPDVPEAIVVVVDKALELEKADRWPTARDMQGALRLARRELDGATGADADDGPTVALAAPHDDGRTIELAAPHPKPTGAPPSNPMAQTARIPAARMGGATVPLKPVGPLSSPVTVPPPPVSARVSAPVPSQRAPSSPGSPGVVVLSILALLLLLGAALGAYLLLRGSPLRLP